MTDDFANNVIPWHFYNTKTLEDAQSLSTVKDQAELERKITARRGWVTKGLNRIELDKKYHEQFKIQGKESQSRFTESKTFLEVRMAMLVNAFRRIITIIVLDKQTFMDQFDEVQEAYFKGRNVIDALIDWATPRQSVSAVPNAAIPKGLSKGTLDTLKPQNINENSLPQTLFDFNERLRIYMSANGILQLAKQEQQQIARSFLSVQLWNLIRDRITPEMPIFMDKGDEHYIDGEENSMMELLENEFRRLHPTVTRRLALMKKAQRAEQTNLAFLSEVKRDSTAANLRDVDEEALTCMILINGFRSEDLRSELLDLFEVDEDLSLATIESGIRKYEATRKISSYVQGRKSDLFQVSNYKKGQHKAKRENAQSQIVCNNCRQKGHIAARCPSKGQGRPGRSMTRGGGRGKGQGRPSYSTGKHARSQSRGRFQGKSQNNSGKGQKGQKGFKGKSSSHLRSLTQNDDGSSSNDDDESVQETDDRGRYVSYLKVMTSLKPLLGLNHSLPTPRLPVKIHTLKSNKHKSNTFGFQAIADSGATRSCISDVLAKEWNVRYEDVSNEVLLNASGQEMTLTGGVTLDVQYKTITVRVHFLITSDIQKPELILSWHDMSLLKLINFDFVEKNDQIIRKIGNVSFADELSKKSFYVSDDSEKKILTDFNDVISDKMPVKPIKAPPMVIHVDESKIPQRTPYVAPRARPAALEEVAKKDVLQLLKDDIIERPAKPPVMIHAAMHVLKPDGSVRFIVDFSKGCNPITKRTVQPFEPGWHLIRKMKATSRVYMAADFKAGYFQFLIHPDSRKYTGFVTQEGTFVFKRSPMGLVSTGDHFISQSSEIFRNFSGKHAHLHQLVDDCVLEAENYPSLYQGIREFLTICRHYNIGISRKKFQIGSRIKFSGFILDSGKALIDPSKFSAIEKFPAPKDKCNLRSFLGLLGTFNNFYEQISAVRQPLNELLRKNVPFIWNTQVNDAFLECKKLLLGNPRVIRPLNPELDIYLLVDSSYLGIGWSCVQYHGPNQTDQALLGCGSRSLLKAELSYSVTDLEITGLCYSIRKASFWTFGTFFYVVTDHKAIVNIMENKITSLVSPRHVRIREKLAPYRFKTIFCPGKFMTLPDSLSRHPVDLPDEEDEADALDCYASANICNTLATYPYLDEFIENAKNDQEYQMVVQLVKNGYPQKDIKKLHANHPARLLGNVWQDVGYVGDLLTYQGQRLIVPRASRKKILSLLHYSHQGFERTKALAQTAYFWKHMLIDLRNMISNCEKCIMFNQNKQRDPMRPVVSTGPMNLLHADPFYLNGLYYIAIKDNFTGWLFCFKLPNLTSEEIIKPFEEIMEYFGKFDRLITDNQSSFKSEVFKAWTKRHGILHNTSSPGNSPGNGNSENAVREVKRMLKKLDGSWPEFKTALREYNATPRSTNGVSAAEMMFRKKIRGELPCLPSRYEICDVSKKNNRISKSVSVNQLSRMEHQEQQPQDDDAMMHHSDKPDISL